MHLPFLPILLHSAFLNVIFITPDYNIFIIHHQVGHVHTHTYTQPVHTILCFVYNQPANAGDIRDPGSIPGWGRSPGGGRGNLLQYSCSGNHMDRGAWGLQFRGSQRVRHN